MKTVSSELFAWPLGGYYAWHSWRSHRSRRTCLLQSRSGLGCRRHSSDLRPAYLGTINVATKFIFRQKNFNRQFTLDIPILAFLSWQVSFIAIGNFIVNCSVAWPLDGCEAGGDRVLIQTSLLLSCKCT